MPPETLRALLDEGRRVLHGRGIETAALDARLLLQRACGVSHETIVARPGQAVGDEPARGFRAMLTRRAGHEPVSRILGEREFYGRAFAVTPAVFDPRPETETLIEEVLTRLGGQFRFADLGTGSGAIAVTVACERPMARGAAIDISAAALAVARANAARHGAANIDFIEADWLAGVTGEFDVILANPPYIRRAEIAALAPEVREHEPPLSLDGGADGLDAYRRIAAAARAPLLIVEIGVGQEDAATGIFAAHGMRRLATRRDLGDRVRCLTFGH
jgi:release factor glutamine methyltransferase